VTDTPTPDLYPWLPLEKVTSWLKLPSPDVFNDSGGGPGYQGPRYDEKSDQAKVARADIVRQAAAEWVQDQRGDLVDEDGAFQATPRVVIAGLLSAARLYARVDSPNGVVAFDELGAGSILSKDPDVARYLGRGKFRVG
jgi:hypothetical protein